VKRWKSAKNAALAEAKESAPGILGGIFLFISGIIGGYFSRIESISKWVFCRPGSGILNTWINGFFHPLETEAPQGKNASIFMGLDSVLLFIFFYSFVLFAFFMIIFTYLPVESESMFGTSTIPNIFQFGANMLVFAPIMNAVAVAAAFLAAFVSARLLGGAAKLQEHFYGFSLIFCGSSFLLFFISIVTSVLRIPIASGPDFSMVGIIIFIACSVGSILAFVCALSIFAYMFYAYFILIRKMHSLSTFRSIIVLAIFIIFAVIVNSVAMLFGNAA